MTDNMYSLKCEMPIILHSHFFREICHSSYDFRMQQLRFSFFICLILLAFGCESQPSQTSLAADSTSTKENPAEIEFLVDVSTYVEPQILRDLPAGFVLDSTFAVDTLTGHSMTVHFPKSLNDQAWNKQLAKRLEKERRAYFPDRPIEEYASSMFEMWVSAYSPAKNQFQFKVHSYYSGAAHHNIDSLDFLGAK